ncbi:putative ribonuclease H-like domain-containing protein [Tanacetum coccineum]
MITDKSKKGFGYNVVPSPHPLILNRPTPLDLSYSGLEEFKEPEVNEYGPRDSSLKPTIGCDKESDNSKENTDDSLEQHQITDTETSSVKSSLKVDKDWKEKFFYPANHVREVEPKKVRENNDAPIIEDWVSDDEDDDEPNPKVKKKTVIPTATKKEFLKLEKPVKRSVGYVEMYRSQRPRGNQRNWNGQKSNQLGCNFVFNNKACFICGSFDHIQYSYPNQQRKRIVSGNNYNKKDNDYYSKTSHSSAHKHMAPKAVLMKTGLRSVNTARPVNTVRFVNTSRPFSTARARGFNDVKPSGYWVWRPIKPNGASLSNSQLNDKGFVDSRCSRHMTGNIAHLLDFKDFDGGYVTFGGGAYGGRITGTGTIKTGNLDFDDVYFVKELKFNLFSVSQMCDKKNYVLFTDSECLVLSPNFKLPDENQILLKIPRQDNMYSFDMKNIVYKNLYADDGLQDENDATEKSHDDSSSFRIMKLITATPERLVGPSHASEDTQVEDQEIELGNIPQSYAVPTTPHTRIHKDHPIEHVIGIVHHDLHTVFLLDPLSGRTKRVLKLSGFQLGRSNAGGTPTVQTAKETRKDDRGCHQKQARLVAQGHIQEEGIDYDEVFAHVARIEAIRMFLAYASYMGFMVYQMDVKSAFLYGQIKEKVYVCQPPGFEDPDHPDKVLKERLTKHYSSRDKRGHILALFNYMRAGHYLWRSTKKELCDEFEKLMKDKF